MASPYGDTGVGDADGGAGNEAPSGVAGEGSHHSGGDVGEEVPMGHELKVTRARVCINAECEARGHLECGMLQQAQQRQSTEGDKTITVIKPPQEP